MSSSLESWGPPTNPRQVRVLRVCELVAELLGLSLDEASEAVRAQTEGAHRYLLLGELGRSSHALVHLAVDQLLARKVALKIHLEPTRGAAEWTALREARTQVLFEHDNVVRLFDAGVCEGRYYWVTELCDEHLGTWARGKPWAVVLRRVLEAGRGLQALHAAGIVHGDIKPQNIMVREGVAKLGDFGLSGPADAQMHVGGTLGYIAPELARGFEADLFALACTAWACVFGELPHEVPSGEGSSAALSITLERARAGALRAPPRGSEVPARIVEVLGHGLAPDPTLRPRLGEWLAELEWCVNARTRRYGLRAVGWISGCVGLLVTGGVLHALWVDPEPGREAGREVSTGEHGEAGDEAWNELWQTVESEMVPPAEQLELLRDLVEEAESTSSIKKAKQAALALGGLRVIAQSESEEFRREVAALAVKITTLQAQP